MVTIADVRNYLNDLSDEHVKDPTIRIQIRLAEGIVENEKSSSATQEQIEDAILAVAGELTYSAYTTEMERGLGVLPPPVATHMTDLKAMSELFLGYVRRGSPVAISIWKLSAGLWTSKIAGT